MRPRAVGPLGRTAYDAPLRGRYAENKTAAEIVVLLLYFEDYEVYMLYKARRDTHRFQTTFLATLDSESIIVPVFGVRYVR